MCYKTKKICESAIISDRMLTDKVKRNSLYKWESNYTSNDVRKKEKKKKQNKIIVRNYIDFETRQNSTPNHRYS